MCRFGAFPGWALRGYSAIMMDIENAPLGLLLKRADWMSPDDIKNALIHEARQILVEPPAHNFFSDVNKIPMFTVISRNSYYLGGMMSQRLVIGRYCSISHNVDLGGTAHDMAGLSTGYLSQNFYDEIKERQNSAPGAGDPITVVGCDVWIGVGAFIKGGVSVGHGAVIGAHSVVTSDVPPYAVMAGNPARVIRNRFDDKTIERLLKSQWWTLPAKDVAALPKENVEKCLAMVAAIRGT